MKVLDWIGYPIEAVSIWLNPQRKTEIVLRRAVEAAEQLILIYQKRGVYLGMKPERLKKFETHYLKRFEAWKDGIS